MRSFNRMFIGLALIAGAGATGSALAQEVMLTQSEDPNTVLSENTVACGNETNTAANSYFRSFPLSYTEPLTVTSLEIGIENARHPTGSQEIEISIYTDSNGGGPKFADLTLIASVTHEIEDQQETIIDIPIEAVIPGDATMVVEIHSPNYIGMFPGQVAVFYPGSNSSGESAPTYVFATTCGDPDIISTSEAGIVGMHLVMTVHGEVGAGCYADCDESGSLDFFDVLCFLNEFNTASDYADCDESGSHDFFDVLCFLNAFNEPGPACP